MDYITNGKHYPFDMCKFEGTRIWCSINAHKDFALSRRDDLESLGYIILSFTKPELITWYGLENNDLMLWEKEKLKFTIQDHHSTYYQFIKRASNLYYYE